MLTEKSLLSLIEKGENTNLEFKRRKLIFENFKLARSLAAMGNSGGGNVLIGVEDDGGIEEIFLSNQDQDHITEIATHHCDPAINIEFYKIKVGKGEVGVITVPPMRKGFPFAVLDHGSKMFFKRVVSSIRTPTILELQEMFEVSKPPRKIDIITDDVPKTILEKISNIPASEINGIFFSSPWLSELGISDADNILAKASKRKKVEILTRPPKETWHRERVEFLKSRCKANIYVNEALHAKMYIVSAGKASFAVFGSPNFTSSARTNLEVAMVTHDNSIVDELFNIFQINLKPLCIIL